MLLASRGCGGMADFSGFMLERSGRRFAADHPAIPPPISSPAVRLQVHVQRLLLEAQAGDDLVQLLDELHERRFLAELQVLP